MERFEYDPGPLRPEDVEISIDHCGLCHSDLSMLDNAWKRTAYPFVPGHEAIGRIAAVGPIAGLKGLTIGQRVGIGWNASSCLHCPNCLAGDHHLCGEKSATIVGRHGAFAERVRVHWLWAVPIPDALSSHGTAPMLCAGVSVFGPLLNHQISPIHHVGVVGVGGLGHLAIKFLAAWGCDVVAFTSDASKVDDILSFGANRALLSFESAQMAELTGALDLILVTTADVTLDWGALTLLLAPKGRLHFVGKVVDPISIDGGPLISGQREISGSPNGSRTSLDRMLGFAARHDISARVQRFPMSAANDAIRRLRAGDARYRIVLDADFA